MKLLNYTTEIEASKTVGEIYNLLTTGGALAVMSEMDGAGNVDAISFRMATSWGPTMYRLPANVPAAVAVLNKMVRMSGRDKISGKYFNNILQARRVAWRIVKDWIEAQIAINQLGQAKLEQIMLPFAVAEDGRTFYQHLLERRSLALPSPQPTEPRTVEPSIVIP